MMNVLNIRLHFEELPLRYNQKTTVSDCYLTKIISLESRQGVMR